MATCEAPGCSEVLRELDRQGRRPRFCSNACRQREYRARRKSVTEPFADLPDSMRARHAWTRRDHKRPIRTDGRPASSTDRSTWASFADALASGAGDGIGTMMGDGLACYDLDHCLDGEQMSDRARREIDAISEPIVYAERSMSGDGLHVFVESNAARGRRVDGVEFYPRGRFIAITGQTFPI